MTRHPRRTPPQPLAAAVVASLKSTLIAIALISGVINVLSLTAPLFMLQVYDRVLASGSVPTLVGLAVLAAGLYIFQAVLDIVRARVLLRIGDDFDHQFSDRVHAAVLRLPLETRMPGDGLQPLRDLDNVRGFLSGNGPTALFDVPWMPLYLGICFLFHFWLGMTALVGAIVLVCLTLLTNALSQAPIRAALEHNMARNTLMEAGRRNAEVVRAMGFADRIAERWQQANASYLAANRKAGDVAGALGGIAKTLRIMLQSAILGVGAYLVIQQETSAGVMIAASIMMGRALAPIDLAIASWWPFLMARQSWARLKDLLALIPAAKPVMALPTPKRDIRVESLAIAPPGETKPIVVGITFTVPAGSALGIIGPSGSGKSTLVRALAAAWRPASGSLRLDGAGFDQWDRAALGRHIGYLPQGVELFEGTIAENIARFDGDAKAEDIVRAAEAAGVHDLIVRFEQGYETRIGEAGSSLSAGQGQRIGLARALYGDPFLVILDEPNANLDSEGEAAVVKAIASVRERGGIAIVVAHRPSAIAPVDLLLAMEAGRTRAFGPRAEVLAKSVKSAPASAPKAVSIDDRHAHSPLRIVPDGGAGPTKWSTKIGEADADS